MFFIDVPSEALGKVSIDKLYVFFTGDCFLLFFSGILSVHVAIFFFFLNFLLVFLADDCQQGCYEECVKMLRFFWEYRKLR